ncbi:MAG TPA: immunoglobulin domain-containing protein, partial [Candidatus Dormibacteraeota bacterium]|nr:immunoglobulin domain-containing protein [Candidatus Dormibacteraeota bacterium]
ARANNQVNSIVVQADGSIIAGGFFDSIGGQPRAYLARLTAAGDLDPTFPDADGVVWCLAREASGRTAVGGTFTHVSGLPRRNIAWITAGGVVDLLFTNGPDGIVTSLAFQRDGKTLVAGNFSHLAGVVRPHLGRIGADGRLDAGFDPQPDAVVYALALQPDGKIMAGGEFARMGGTARLGAARTAAFLQITAQPQPRRIMLDEDLALSVLASGTPPLSYQWFKDGREIPGATNSIHLRPRASLQDAGEYEAAVSNAWGQVRSERALAKVRLVPNDDLAEATVITGVSNQVFSGHNQFATREEGEPSHWEGAIGASVWWTWTAPSDGRVLLDTTGSAFDTVLAVYTGDTP